MLDWIGLCRFCFASNWTGPVHFQTCIGLNRIDPGAALLYYVPDCTGLYRFFLCTGLYRLYYVPVCTGRIVIIRYGMLVLCVGTEACIMCRYGELVLCVGAVSLSCIGTVSLSCVSVR